METFLPLLTTIAGIVTGAGIVAGLLWWISRHERRLQEPRWLHEVTRRRLLVHTRDGQTLDGQLARVDVDGLILEPVTLADGGVSLDGRAWVPRERIAWIQEPST